MTENITGFLSLGLTGFTVWSGTLWFLWSRIQSAKDALTAFELVVAKDYVANRHMKELEDRLAGAIERLGDRLDRRLENS